jgi:acetyl-CoA carboxylase carboxyl transferase subunit alpha
MLENAIYSVISPEGCATILWRDPKKTLEAATAMKLSSKDLLDLSIIDEIIEEPTGGAHRDRDLILNSVKLSIQKNLNEFDFMSRDEILLHRKNKFLSIGRNKGFRGKIDITDNLSMKEDFLQKTIFNIKKFKYQAAFIFFLIIFGLIIFYL